MSENNEDDDKLSVKPKKTLTLRGGGLAQGTVRQNFSHGRSKSVVVETRKRRFAKAPGSAPGAAPGATPEKADEPQKPDTQKPETTPAAKKPIAAKPIAAPADEAVPNLSKSEMDARRRALEEAKARQGEEQQKAEDAARRRADLDARRRADREERKRREEELARKEAEARQSPPAAQAQPAEAKEARDGGRRHGASHGGAYGGAHGGAHGGGHDDDKAKELKPFERKRDDDNDRTARPKPGQDRRRTKLTLTNALDEDGNSRGPSLAAMRRRQEKAKRAAMGVSAPREKIAREVQLPETISIQDLASRMSERAVEVIKLLMKQGQMMKPGDIIDADTAELIASEFGHTVRRVSESDVEEGLFDKPDDPKAVQSRPPVVTIMGHVDHGKTSLLDALRNARVADGEAGGITQHIGAYQIEKNGQKITFIDTPGHEAFTAMRARGAQVTDIAILVVAADDGVMPQTKESISHAKAAEVPIIVAINKIDLASADPSRVRNELLQSEIFVESMGGDILEIEVSAKEGTNLDKLLEAILLQSEILELKADPTRSAEGIVVESQLDRGRGPVATVLVKRGTLKTGDIVIAGNEWGKVRAMINDHGQQIDEAEPAMPIELLGLSGAPSAGDQFAVVENEAKAREIADYRQRLARDKAAARQAGTRGSLEQMMTQLQTSELQEVPIVLKSDVQGSAEAIAQSLEKLATEEVAAKIMHSGVGGITESDIALAMASNAPILAFNVRANQQAKEASAREGVEIRYYSIIYDLVDDIKKVMSGKLAPEKRETFLGYAEILEVFNVSKIGKVAGCRVTEGKVARGSGVRLLRDDVVIHEGKLSTLKRFKDEVGEVPVGQECGMAFENYQDIRQGDQIECFHVEEIERSL